MFEQELEQAAKAKLKLLLVLGLQPSEYDGLTQRELELFEAQADHILTHRQGG